MNASNFGLYIHGCLEDQMKIVALLNTDSGLYLYVRIQIREFFEAYEEFYVV